MIKELKETRKLLIESEWQKTYQILLLVSIVMALLIVIGLITSP